jgi:hypothetical protein
MTTHKGLDEEELLVHNWRVDRLTRLGVPWSLAEVYADRLDWHQVARLVQRGCPPRLALRIASGTEGGPTLTAWVIMMRTTTWNTPATSPGRWRADAECHRPLGPAPLLPPRRVERDVRLRGELPGRFAPGVAVLAGDQQEPPRRDEVLDGAVAHSHRARSVWPFDNGSPYGCR